jgi:folate-binding protein YgfZ
MSDFWTATLAQAPESKAVEDTLCTLYPVTNRSVLLAHGVDAAKFMQGQFTCNLGEISETQFRHGACCNAKGRMVANFTLAKPEQDNAYLLALDSSVSDALQAHLKKYMVFFKSKLETTDYVVTGIKGEQASRLLTEVFGDCPAQDYQQHTFEGGLITQLPFNAGFEIWLTHEKAQTALPTLMQSATLADTNSWPKNLIQSGLPQLTHVDIEAHIPQMLNLGLLEGISFSKGCYTGQEIVARMQYLGKMKRHMYLVSIQSSNIVSGDSLYTANAKSAVGSVINAVVNTEANSNQSLALAVIEDKHINAALFSDSDLGTSVELLSLPYDPQYDPQKTDE